MRERASTRQLAFLATDLRYRGNTPLDDARREKRNAIVKILGEWHAPLIAPLLYLIQTAESKHAEL